MRRWRWGVFGVVALGVGGMGVWAGVKLKEGPEPLAGALAAADKDVKPSPQPQDPVSPPALPETKGVGPAADSGPPEKPVPAPVALPSEPKDPVPVSPLPEATKDREVKPPAPPTSSVLADPKPVPAAPPSPIPMPPDHATAPPSPRFPEPAPLPTAATPPVPQPAPTPTAPVTPSKPSQPDFSSMVPGIAGGPVPPPSAPQPVPPPSSPGSALPPPPPPPTGVDPAKFEPAPEGAKAGLPRLSPVPVPDENSKPNNIFRALPGSAEADPAPVPTNSPWTVQIKVVQGRTELEAQNGDTVHLRISCQHMQVQAPNGNIQAQGDVKLSGSDLNGSCDVLTIIWHKEDVLMEGKVHLKCPKDAQEIDLAADRLSVKLTNVKTAKAIDRKESSDILRAWTGLLSAPQDKPKR